MTGASLVTHSILALIAKSTKNGGLIGKLLTHFNFS